MQPFVLDASLAITWCFADESTHYTRSILKALESTHAVVPALWPFEVANAMVMAERRGRITESGVQEFLAGLQRLPIYIDRRDPGLLWPSIHQLAREHKLSGYDAAYLELAKREAMPLATLDEELQSACKGAGVVLVAS